MLTTDQRELALSFWEGFCLLSLCTGSFVFHWLTAFTDLPLDDAAWCSLLGALPGAVISWIEIARLHREQDACSISALDLAMENDAGDRKAA